MSLYGILHRNLLYPLYESVLRRRRTLRYLAELQTSQWMTADEVRARQWERLRGIVAYAYDNVPFYRRSFDERGVRPEDMRSPGDLCRLPLLEKTHLREHQQDLIAGPWRTKSLIVSHSGGSTGRPVEFRYNRDHYDRRIAAWIRADEWAGYRLGEPQFILMLAVGSGVGERPRLEVWKERLQWAFMRSYVRTCTRLSLETAREHHRLMCRVRPRVMFCYAHAAYTFALLLEELGLEPPPMEGIILGGEQAFPGERRKVEEVFGTPTFNRYGCQEFCNIGEECDRHQGMHINADGLYVEVVDESGNPVQPGEVGEIVVTGFDNMAMPFIRYRLGDMGVLAKAPCSCGRGLPLLSDVVGRSLDMIATPEGNFCSGVMMPHLMKEFTCVREFQFVQESVGHLTVRIVPGEGWGEGVVDQMERELRRYVGQTMEVEFQEVEELERTATNKRRMVISNVPVEAGAVSQ